MKKPKIAGLWTQPLTVGSVADEETLASLDPKDLEKECDLVEIRLDGLAASGSTPSRRLWSHLECVPLLFTARCASEGGCMEWDAVRRAEFLSDALPDASMIDIEAANIDSMAVVIDAAISAGIPWIASFHNFDRFPSENELLDALARAHSAGASAFKWAALLADRDEMSRMAEFQFRNHRMPVASMGMGALGAESRVLAALAGSVLNYGYLGDHPTAPGQWHAGRLKSAIAGPSART